ncbi:cingulin-like protein 1 isoform X2 [Thalassophryne amazonica]|uniref:cingulin-like protein 1 isoform X2 n=1 Tax=Thalassophryne amazonica TaxID=390379 RepID=UPI00147120A3|nr:cingulin-like protein 1 isoform X2 [Thalassophryne amazonica]
METYRVTGIPDSGSQRGYTQPPRSSRPHSNGAGTYGLSIRVQGIDGHPYVVLNNQDRGPQSYIDPNSNGYIDTESSFIDNYHEYDFRGGKEADSNSPFVEYRSQKMMHYTGPQNGLADSQAKKLPNLLNFQKHPEILQPYDPQTNSLNLEGFNSLPSRPLSLAETRNQRQSSTFRSVVPAGTRARSSSLDRNKASAQLDKRQLSSWSQIETVPAKPKSQCLPPAQLDQPQERSQAQVAQPQTKPYLTNFSPLQMKPTSKPQSQHQLTLPPQPQISSVSSPINEQSKTSVRSPSSMSSADSRLECTHREPDVLPLHRTDSSGPVLQSSTQSRHASSPSSKTLLDDQMDALYADTINRHENRRYIPFLAGSGRDIDTGSIPGVDELIEKFDGSQQRQGRAGRRNRIKPEDRKRSRSVDSALPFVLEGDSTYMHEFSHHRGTSSEHVLRPSQLRLQKTAGNQNSWVMAVDGELDSRASSRGASAPGSPQSTVSRGVGSIHRYRKPQTHFSSVPFKSKESEENTFSAGTNVTKASTSLSKSASTADKKTTTDGDPQVTPDLLKGQQELSQQTHEETAKQILFSYLKEGSNENDEATKRKVNLVFEKIQTLKSRATASSQVDDKSLNVAAQTKALQEQNAALEKELANSKRQLEDQSKKSQLEAEKKSTSRLTELQQQLDRSAEECKRLKEKLAKTEAELQNTVEELFQVKMEREQYQTEIRDLQDQLSEMHDELDSAKKSDADGEKDALMADMMHLKVEIQEALLAKEDQEEVLRRRERELTALKGALKEEVAAHDQEVDKLKEQYEKEITRLKTSLEEAKQSSAAVTREKAEMEAAKDVVEGQAGRLTQEADQLRKRAQELENEVAKLNQIIDEAKLQESRLWDRLSRLEREKKQLEESLAEIREQEEEMSRANRALTIRLEDVQRNLTKLSSEHKELEEMFQEEKNQKEKFKNMKNGIEDERRLLDQTVEKLQREMNEIVEISQLSTRELQEQIDIYKEKNRRELAELQRLLKERGQELEKSHQEMQTLKEELSQRKENLQQCQMERDEALTREKAMEKKFQELEVEAETNAHAKEDKSRQLKLMEERLAQLQMDLDEERQSGDQLIERIDRGREQNKDLKSRVDHLEGTQKSNKEGLVAQLEDRVHELEQRLESEERERANMQLSNRRLERKVKEMMMQVEEEHHSMQDQKNQLNLRLKALKRQMDEAEEEIDRLEHSKKKLQRDLDEQHEVNEQLQSQMKVLRNEIRRKATSVPLLSNLDDEDDDDDDLSTDGETYFSSSLMYKRSASQENISA